MKNAFTILVMLSGVMLALASCSEEIRPDNDNQTPVVRIEKIGVKTEALTKVSLDGTTFSWNDGDQIAVWTGTSDTGGSFQDCSVSSNSITVMLEEGASRRNYAVYPASAKDGFHYGQSTMNVKLPATYSFSEILDTKTPLPMIAANTAGNSLSFYNVAGLFRVTVKAIPDDATGLVFEFPGKKVNGTFSVQNPSSNAPTISTGAPASGESKITVTFPAKPTRTVSEYTFNIPLPTGNYGDVYITPIGSATKVAAARHIMNIDGGYTAARARGVKLTATLVSFSVYDQKVIFSPGNLQATYNGAWRWHFASKQYSYIGSATANTNISGNYSVNTNGTVDLFGWSSNNVNNTYGINNSTSNDPYEGNFVDWGNNTIDSYPSNFWHSTSIGTGNSDWVWLLGPSNATPVPGTNCRTSSTVCGTENARFAKIQVNGVYGVILFPDVYRHPDGVADIANINSTTTKWTSLSINYSETNWNKMEDAGAIFLPAAGTRQNCTVYNSNDRGTYWTMNQRGSTQSLQLYFDPNGFSGYSAPESTSAQIFEGRSVRLVHDL